MPSDDIDELLRRFHNFDDAVIRAISVAYHSRESAGTCRIEVSSRDHDTRPNAGVAWVNVIMNIADFREFRLTESNREPNQVLSGGVHKLDRDGVRFLVFNRWDAPRSLEEVRASDFYVAGSRVDWEVIPFRESVV